MIGANVSAFSIGKAVGGSAKNLDPVITSSPVTTGTQGVAYSYQVQATDPEGGSLTYTLPTKPSGMTISGSGLIAWTPSSSGSESVVVRVTDNKGAFAEQSYSIAVAVAPLTWANNNSRPYIATASGYVLNFAVPITSSTSSLRWEYSNNGGTSWIDWDVATIVTPTNPLVFNGTTYYHYAKSPLWSAGNYNYIHRFGGGTLFSGITSQGETIALANNAGNYTI